MIGCETTQTSLQQFVIVTCCNCTWVGLYFTGSPVGASLQRVTNSGDDLSLGENMEQQTQYCRGQKAKIQSSLVLRNKKENFDHAFHPFQLPHRNLSEQKHGCIQSQHHLFVNGSATSTTQKGSIKKRSQKNTNFLIFGYKIATIPSTAVVSSCF